MSRFHYLVCVNKWGKYIAHCLDFDIVTSADSRDEAIKRLSILVAVHTKHFTTHIQAPCEYWDRYHNSPQTVIADERPTPAAAKGEKL